MNKKLIDKIKYEITISEKGIYGNNDIDIKFTLYDQLLGEVHFYNTTDGYKIGNYYDTSIMDAFFEREKGHKSSVHILGRFAKDILKKEGFKPYEGEHVVLTFNTRK